MSNVKSLLEKVKDLLEEEIKEISVESTDTLVSFRNGHKLAKLVCVKFSVEAILKVLEDDCDYLSEASWKLWE